MTAPQRPTHSGYPVGVVHPTRRAARRGAHGSRVRRGAAWAGSALLLALGAAALWGQPRPSPS